MTQKQRMLMGFAVASVIIAAGMSQRALGQAAAAQGAKRAGGVPTFQQDPAWPPTLPNNWVMGLVSSVAIDRRDHVFLLHRPRILAEDKKDRPAAPAVLEFDAAGKFVQAWGGPADGYEWPDNEHGIYVDYKDIVWIGGQAGTGSSVVHDKGDDDMLLKFTTKGKFLQQIGRRNQSTGNKDTKNLKEPADVFVYRKTNEVFVADGYGNRRVIVLDADTGAFKRMWGAFGNIPLDPPPPPAPGTTAPAPANAAPPPPPGPPQFAGPVHCVKVSNDGLVYVADRTNGRVQVFTIDGKYVTQLFSGRGPGALALSPDPQQQFLYVGEGGRVDVVNRKTLEVVGEFGKGGHHIATDSKGNLYTAELGNGTEKFLFKGLSSGATQ